MICMIVYGHFIATEEEVLDQGQLQVSWCFILAGVAAGIIFISGSLGVIEILLNPKYVRFTGSAGDTGNSEEVETREMDNPVDASQA